MLEEGVSDHRHKRMTVKALPGSSLEVIKTEFFFHLLVNLLANPAPLKICVLGRQRIERRVRAAPRSEVSGRPCIARLSRALTHPPA